MQVWVCASLYVCVCVCVCVCLCVCLCVCRSRCTFILTGFTLRIILDFATTVGSAKKKDKEEETYNIHTTLVGNTQ